MAEDEFVPGKPTPSEFIELLTNPDLSVPGIIAVDGSDLPPDVTLGRLVRTKLSTPGTYVETDSLSARRIIILDKSRPELIPESLLNSAEGDRDELTEIVGNAEYDIIINLLRDGDDGELGESVRTTLLEQEKVYDSESDGPAPGHYCSLNNNEKRKGEQRAYVVVAGS